MDKKACTELIVGLVEIVDDKLGGPVMDLPVVDKIERKFIESVVDIIWELEVDINNHVINHDPMPWSA